MGYKDPEKRKTYHREYQRVKRKQETQDKTPVKLFRETHSEFRIKTAKDILDLLEQTINEVASLEVSEVSEIYTKARTIGYLAQIAIKAVETSDLESRLEAIENILKIRSAA